MNHLKICPINLWCESVASQTGCHFFILALLGMVIGSQSTSNGWIGSQLVWLRAFAGSVCVHSFVFGGARLCTLASFFPQCLQQHVCVTPSSLSFSLCPPLPPTPFSLSFEFGVLSIITSTAALLFLARRPAERNGISANEYSWLCRQITIKTQLNVIPVEMSVRADAARAAVATD